MGFGLGFQGVGPDASYLHPHRLRAYWPPGAALHTAPQGRGGCCHQWCVVKPPSALVLVLTMHSMHSNALEVLSLQFGRRVLTNHERSDLGLCTCVTPLPIPYLHAAARADPFIDSEYAAYMFKYDSVHRTYPGTVSVAKDGLHIDGRLIKSYSVRCAGAKPLWLLRLIA